MAQKKNDFSKGSVGKNILSLAIPLTVAQLTVVLYNVVDRAFIGAGGVTLEGGISDYNSEEAIVRQAIIRRAQQTVLVVDSAKFGTNAFAAVCGLDEIDVVVSDENLDDEFRDGLSKWRNLDVILAPAVDEPDDVDEES